MGTGAKAAVLAVIAAVTFGIVAVAMSGSDGDDAPAAATSPTAAQSPADDGETDGSRQGSCTGPAEEDPSYEVTVTSEPDPPRAEGTTFVFTVTRDGEPVSDALVCLVAGMSDMAHEDVIARASESEPGTYEATTGFVMRGAWDGTVRVVPSGGDAVRVPLPLSVQ